MIKKSFRTLGFCCFCICLFACSSNKDIVYQPLNYTSRDVRLNEIEQIKLIADKEPVAAMWRSYLVKNALYEENSTESGLDNARDLNLDINEYQESLFFDGQVQNLIALYQKAQLDNDWFTAVKLYQSLEAVGRANNLSSITTGYKEACSQYSDAEEAPSVMDYLYFRLIDKSGVKTLFPQLVDKFSSANDLSKPAEDQSLESPSIENPSIENRQKVSSFINGTVTVWLDLGVKVEKGMGYAERVIGSGFFIDKTGYLVTNYHVISSEVDPEYEGYSRLFIKLASDSETRIPAKVVGWDKSLDLALLKTEASVPYVFSLGSSSDLDVGDKIYAIGSPVGLEKTLTSGVVSASERKLFSIGSVMQIDAAVNSGNSGGPIINEKGFVQAVVFAGLPEYDGLNFAIPVEYLKYDLTRLCSGGEVLHPWLGAFGITAKDPSQGNNPCGVLVQYVMPGSTASRSGITKGDIIKTINNNEIKTIEEFKDFLLHLSPEIIVSVTIQKNNGIIKTVPVYLEKRPDYPGYEVYSHDLLSHAFYPVFGMELIPVDSIGSKKYTIASVLKGSIADESGFSENDPIEIEKTKLLEKNSVIYAELYTKKRKSGYLDVSIAISAPLDSSNYF